ncbi:hypothetical protein BRAS3843_2860025 [Bradyrhizobium sp. STM 3843]|nr:hypothetical protein BRAS3843_2860025 [Bradyrhizobium sp. STM 3843]
MELSVAAKWGYIAAKMRQCFDH